MDILDRNPLLNFKSYTVKNVLTAHTTTEDALSKNIDFNVGKNGTVFDGDVCGKKNVVVINEYLDPRFFIINHTNEFTYTLNPEHNTTIMSGNISIVDKVSGYFQDFLKGEVSDVLDIAQTHIVFALRSYITGTTYSDKKENIILKPLIFHAVNLSHGFSETSSQNMYIMTYLADYNGYGLQDNYSKTYQMTVTHKDNNYEISPTNSPSTFNDKIIQKENTRQATISKDAPMFTLKDAFDGFDVALKRQSYTTKSSLQDWNSIVKNNYTKKTKATTQKKDDGLLPITYNISLDGEYDNYLIDNRNLYFEQPDVSQNVKGLKYYSVKPGKHILRTIKNLMKLSSKIGDDILETQPKTFKINMNTIKTCDEKYNFDISIKKYIIPKNDGSYESGPGDYSIHPLEFNYQRNKRDMDILAIHTSLNSDNALETLDDINQNNKDDVILSQREQVMNERASKVPFFKNSYSGLRTMTNIRNYTLEKPLHSVNFENAFLTELQQQSKITVVIIGNPNFLSDLFRNPIKVSENDNDGPNYYSFPEFYPMYAKLDIYLKPSDTLGLIQNNDINRQYYYNGYYHIGKVVTSINGSQIKQKLELYRTDLSA